MNPSAFLGLVAPARLANYHRRAERPLRPVISGIDSVVHQERQQTRTLLAKALRQAPIVHVAEAPTLTNQRVQTASQSRHLHQVLRLRHRGLLFLERYGVAKH